MKYISIIALVVVGILTSTANAAPPYAREAFEGEVISKQAPASTVAEINEVLRKNKVKASEVEDLLRASGHLISKKNRGTGEGVASIVGAMSLIEVENRLSVTAYASGIVAGAYASDAIPAEVVLLAISYAKKRIAAGEPTENAFKIGILFYQDPGKVFIRKKDSVYAIDPSQYGALQDILGISDIKGVDKRFTKFEVSEKTLSGGKGEFAGNFKVAIPVDWPK